MAGTIIPGRGGTATVIHDTWTPHGEIGGQASRKEDPNSYGSGNVSDRELAKIFGVTVDEIHRWEGLGVFPGGRDVNTTARPSLRELLSGSRAKREYSRERIAERMELLMSISERWSKR